MRDEREGGEGGREERWGQGERGRGEGGKRDGDRGGGREGREMRERDTDTDCFVCNTECLVVKW